MGLSRDDDRGAPDARVDGRRALALGLGRERGRPARPTGQWRAVDATAPRTYVPVPRAGSRVHRERAIAPAPPRRRARGRLRRKSASILVETAFVENGLANWPPEAAGCAGESTGGDPSPVVPRSARNRRRGGALPRRGARSCRRGAHLAGRRASRCQGSWDLPRHGREWVRAPGGLRADGRRALARAGASLRGARARAGAPSASDRGRGRYSLCTGDLGVGALSSRAASTRVRRTRSSTLTRLAAVTPPSDALRDKLAELIAIPSVSADAAHAADIEAAAAWVAGAHPRRGRHCRARPLGPATARHRGDPRVRASRVRADDPLLRALRRPAARPARALGVAAVRADAARRQAVGARRRRRQGQPLHARRGRAAARGGGLVAGERPLRLRRRGGDRRQLDRRVAGAGRGSRGRGPDPRRRDGLARAADLLRRRARDALFPPPRADGDDGHALGHVRSGRAERDARAHERARERRAAGGRLPARRAPRGSDTSLGGGARRVGAASVGARAADALRRDADRGRRRRELLSADVRGHLARRERDRERLARSREDRASGRGARERLDPTRSRSGSRQRSAPRSSGSCARGCPTEPSSRSR